MNKASTEGSNCLTSGDEEHITTTTITEAVEVTPSPVSPTTTTTESPTQTENENPDADTIDIFEASAWNYLQLAVELCFLAIETNTNNQLDRIDTSGCEDIAIACKYSDCKQGRYRSNIEDYRGNYNGSSEEDLRLFHDVFLNIVNDRKSRNSIDLKNLRKLQKRSTNKRNSKSKRRRNKSNKKTNKSKKRKAMNQISRGKKIEKSKNKKSKKKATSKSKNSNKESL